MVNIGSGYNIGLGLFICFYVGIYMFVFGIDFYGYSFLVYLIRNGWFVGVVVIIDLKLVFIDFSIIFVVLCLNMNDEVVV